MQGGVWIFLGRWSIRGIGVLSTIILARLLAPADFGLVAICLLLTGLAQAIGEEGQDLAVIRKQNLDRSYMDSAWTASIITGVALGAGVLALAPLVAAYFNEPRAKFLIQILSIRVFMMGFYNIGVALNRRDFNFAKDFTYNVLEKIFPAVITVLLAYYLRNYWALVIGSVAGYAGAIAASYALHSYRPRLCFKHLREVWAFSGWVVLEKFASFGSVRIDQFFIPAVGGATQLGHYHVGSELARMPVGELFMPLDRVLFPAYARLMQQPGGLANAYIQVLSVAAIVCLPVSIGFAMIASDFTQLVYGEKWIPMIPVVELIAIASGVAALISTVTPILQAAGKSRLSAGLICLQAALLVTGLYFLQYRFNDIGDIALVRLAAILLTLPIALMCVHWVVSLPVTEIIKAFWRPIVAVSGMTLMLYYVLPQNMDLPAGLRMALRVAAGGLVYAALLAMLWLLSGQPAGAERNLLELMWRRRHADSVARPGG